ncbi:MAG: hypothetical protein ACJAXA_002833, partial [Candidatus Aldehydirespiratoraceae bacterium]
RGPHPEPARSNRREVGCSDGGRIRLTFRQGEARARPRDGTRSTSRIGRSSRPARMSLCANARLGRPNYGTPIMCGSYRTASAQVCMIMGGSRSCLCGQSRRPFNGRDGVLRGCDVARQIHVVALPLARPRRGCSFLRPSGHLIEARCWRPVGPSASSGSADGRPFSLQLVESGNVVLAVVA